MTTAKDQILDAANAVIIQLRAEIDRNQDTIAQLRAERDAAQKQGEFYRLETHRWKSAIQKVESERDEFKRERDALALKLAERHKPFVCFDCGTCGPELICPNCGEDRVKAKAAHKGETK